MQGRRIFMKLLPVLMIDANIEQIGSSMLPTLDWISVPFSNVKLPRKFPPLYISGSGSHGRATG
jgi:hypothetical protein